MAPVSGPGTAAGRRLRKVDWPRLDGIELRWLDLHLRDAHRSAAGTLVARPVVIVRTVTDRGEGWGECAALALPDYSEEYAEGVWAVLTRHLIPLLAFSARADLGRAVRMKRVLSTLSPVRGHRMAKACLEMAFVDEDLRASDRSLADLLGVSQTSVRAGAVIGIPTDPDPERLDHLAESAQKLVADGYERLKVKIAPGSEISTLATVVEAVPDARVVADANGAYRFSDEKHLRALESIDDLGLACIEQPLDPDDLLGHRRLAQRLKTPICLDESASSLGRIAEAIELGACGMVCVKPGRLGGILAAAEAQHLCAQAGIPVYCGGMLETHLARSANAALSGLAGFTLPGDLSGGERFTEPDPFLAGAGSEAGQDQGPVVTIHRGPGVGPAPDPRALDRVTTRTEWFAV
jgi:o-succinylbenzoate synthase